MRSPTLVAVLLASPFLCAQQAATSPASVVLQNVAHQIQGCPVGLDARHADVGRLLSVKPSAHPPRQSYRLTLTPRGDRTIAQARVTLHGMSGAHVIPAAGEAHPAEPSSAESFNLAPSSGAHKLFHSTVFTEKLTGVQWVELNELTYADGSVWHESTAHPCRVAPDGFMLVAGQ